MQTTDEQRLLFLDECNSHVALTPHYGRAPKGQRATGQIPRNNGKNTTLRPGDSVVMDNLAVHTAPSVRQCVEACGA